MPAIHSALVTAILKPENKQRLQEALAPAQVHFLAPNDFEGISRVIDRVDVAITNGDANDQILSGKNLRWIHCCHAGLDKTVRPDIFQRDIILTGSSGRSAPALAEHAFMFMLALTYDVTMLQRAKDNKHWAARESFGKSSLYSKTVGIIGLGKTGEEIAKRAKAFSMKVLAWRRKDTCPEYVDRLYAADKGEGIDELLRESDYAVLCCELNDETWHLINGSTLSLMKPKAFLIATVRSRHCGSCTYVPLK